MEATSEIPGRVILVPTPIGNLGDITLRALEILRGADRIACEDTRHSGQLLAHHGISGKPLVSLHEHNEARRAPELIAAARAGAVKRHDAERLTSRHRAAWTACQYSSRR